MYILYHYTGGYYWFSLAYEFNFPGYDAGDISYWLIPGTYEED